MKRRRNRSGMRRIKRGGAREYFHAIGQQLASFGRAGPSPIGYSDVPDWAHAACLVGNMHQKSVRKHLRRSQRERSRL